MYLIALCDDEAAELSKTEQMLENYKKQHPQTEFAVRCFKSADELLSMVREENYMPDFLLLDIYMPETMGTEAARELRSMGNKSKIIFLTASKEHALEAFGVDALQYLVKPVSEQMLFPLLDRFFKDAEKMRRKYLLLRIDGRFQRVSVNDIVYCEAQGKIQHLHLADGMQYLLHITITEIYEMLSGYREFVRVGIAYIVNLEHVENLNSKELQMDNRKKIYLPRGSYQPLREKYFNYYCAEEENRD